MKNLFRNAASSLFLLLLLAAVAAAQGMVKRTTYKSDSFDFGAGGTLSLTGAPQGSVKVEGWSKNEVQIDAVIELNAPSEADLDQLAKITGFVLEESLGKTIITSIGTHDKGYMKRVAKKFPKQLLGLPFRIDYVIKVPRYCDLLIDGGKGDLQVSGVDGVIKANFLDSNAKFDLVGGAVMATIGGGSVDVTIPTRSWRGRFADISLTSGTMNVNLPPSLNAEIDASILREGRIENTYAALKPKTRKDTFTEKLIAARSGNGGIPLKFTVGDGNLNIAEVARPE
jgi:hypothetical protein